MKQPRRLRTDKDVRDTSVIRGMRMEPDLARRLREHARGQPYFRTADNEGNVVACARHFLRMALGIPAAESIQREASFARAAVVREQIARAYGNP